MATNSKKKDDRKNLKVNEILHNDLSKYVFAKNLSLKSVIEEGIKDIINPKNVIHILNNKLSSFLGIQIQYSKNKIVLKGENLLETLLLNKEKEIFEEIIFSDDSDSTDEADNLAESILKD